MSYRLFCVILIFAVYVVDATKRVVRPFNESQPVSKYNNPNFIRDRYKDEILRPLLPAQFGDRFKQKFHPSWMDYCDPRHCNAYHRRACGLNRKTMRFKWFQSGCHILLHNLCSTFRGQIKYDTIAPKFCSQYKLHLRHGCPTKCDSQELSRPVCGTSTRDNSVVLFRDKCHFDAANCRGRSLNEYEEADLAICAYYL